MDIATSRAAAAVIAGTALVLAPIPPKAARLAASASAFDEPTFDEGTVEAVRTALNLMPNWRPQAELGETETRIIVWSQLELNALYERLGGEVSSRRITQSASDGTTTWPEEEITVTIKTPIGSVQLVTSWCEDLAKFGSRDTLPLTRALAATPPAPAPKD